MRTTLKLWKALNWPNRISLLRLLLVGPFIVLLLNQPDWPWARHAALAIFVAMGISDGLDGMLARRLNARTRLGAILDPLADKALIISAVVLLATRGAGVPPAALTLPNWLVVAVVAKDVWVVAGTVIVYMVTNSLRVRPTRAGKLCTVGQLILVGYTLLAPDLARLAEGLGRWGVLAGSWAVAGLAVFAIMSYTRLGLQFTMTEDKPLEDNGSRANHREPRD